MPIYNGGGGVAGITVESDPSALKMANNLSDLINAGTARTNLQLSSYYAALSHSHAISDVTNLQTTLNGKAALTHSHAISDVTNLQTTLNGKAATSHSHAISDVTNLQTSLDGKASTSHSHVISDVTNLQTTLNGKAASVHTHNVSDVNGWGSIQDAGSNTVLSWTGSSLIWVSRGISDAPSDGSQYARQNGAWAVVTGGGGGGGGISDAPSDNNVYVRVNGAWASLFANSETAATQSWVNGLGFQTASNVSTYVTGLGYQTASNVSTYVTGLGYITDAPNDGSQYVRQTLMGVSQWVLNAGFTFSDAPDSNKYLRTNGSWYLYDGISEAPNDGSTYGRQSLGWVSIPSAILTAASSGTNASGYSNGNFDTSHYPSELALTINGTTYYVPART